ncbi:hypothetical protein [Kitasatospora sp. NPDC050463]|uniref:hypothetical protein n=1 Tax=Kitasatospora sp. NPDC050463 TaxID=3155786 RepID=UPI0033F8737D
MDEWPLAVGALPSVVLLLGAGLGWWPSHGIEYVTFAVNIVLLFAAAAAPVDASPVPVAGGIR